MNNFYLKSGIKNIEWKFLVLKIIDDGTIKNYSGVQLDDSVFNLGNHSSYIEKFFLFCNDDNVFFRFKPGENFYYPRATKFQIDGPILLSNFAAYSETGDEKIIHIIYSINKQINYN